MLYDAETDTLQVEVRPWPAASPAEANEQRGGEDIEEGLVVHYGLDGLPHAYEIEHASERPDLVARALGTPHTAQSPSGKEAFGLAILYLTYRPGMGSSSA